MNDLDAPVAHQMSIGRYVLAFTREVRTTNFAVHREPEEGFVLSVMTPFGIFVIVNASTLEEGIE